MPNTNSDEQKKPHLIETPGKKRDKGFRVSDAVMNVIVNAHLQGKTLREISELIEQRTDEKLHQRDIGHVLMQKRSEWRQKTERDTDMYVRIELDRLSMMESEAWRQYEAVGGGARKEVIEELFTGEILDKRKVRTETKTDTSEARQWFKIIMDIQRSRRTMLDLESQTLNLNTNLIAMKSYVGFTPDEWPDPPALDDPNVIEGEIESGK